MRPHAGGPSRVWTDDTIARVRETLGRHRTIAGAAAELGMSASGIQSAFWSRREQIGGVARDFLMRSSAPVSAAAIPVVQGSAPAAQVERPYAGAATVAEPNSVMGKIKRSVARLGETRPGRYKVAHVTDLHGP